MWEKKYFEVIKGVKIAKNYVDTGFHRQPKWQKNNQIVPNGPSYFIWLGYAKKKTLQNMTFDDFPEFEFFRYHPLKGGCRSKFFRVENKRQEEVLLRLFCKFEPSLDKELDERVIFRTGCSKSTYYFRGFGIWRKINFFVYFMMIGSKFFTVN